ncbi:MAG: Na+/H+ antiporter subunit E [Oscillospiraceae bacterium]|nr:Na+/H+ antiporter subunit E [Oscillospiraceae bacterium]
MLFLLFVGMWIVFNGRFTIEILIFGIVLAAALYLFVWKVMGFGPKQEKEVLKKFGKMVLYGLLVFKEIVKANWGVLKIVLNPKSKIEPKMVYFKTDLKKDTSKVALANSITITPGTITVNVCDDVFCVHALDASMADGIDECDFVVKLREMEGKK